MPIDPENVREVRLAAVRLTAAITAHENRIKADKEYATYYPIVGGKETSAIRRASMDLTRALAKLRSRG